MQIILLLIAEVASSTNYNTISLQFRYLRQSLATTPTKTINMAIYFENITVGLYILYIFNTHIKFCANKMLFTIQFINLFFIYNFRLQKLEIYTFN